MRVLRPGYWYELGVLYIRAQFDRYGLGLGGMVDIIGQIQIDEKCTDHKWSMILNKAESFPKSRDHSETLSFFGMWLMLISCPDWGRIRIMTPFE